MKPVKIYLSGSIRKGSTDLSKKCWEGTHIEEIKSKLGSSIFLNPLERGDDLNDSFARFGRDLFQVSSSDFVLVDGRERRGIGVGGEMVVAKLHQIPVISIVPKNTYYQKDQVTILGQECKDWVHPFIHGLSDVIVTDLDEAISWMKDHLQNPKQIKDQRLIPDSILHYKTHQFPQDKPMQDIFK